MSGRDPVSQSAEGARADSPRLEEYLEAEIGGGTPRAEGPAPYLERGTPEFSRAAAALVAAGFATFAVLYCVQPMMPLLSAAFGVTAAESSLVLSASTATLALGLLFTGPLSDAVGRKPIMVAALVGASLCTLGSAAMPSWRGMLGVRALIGLCLSGVVAVALTYLSEEIHPRVLGWSMGLYIAGTAIGGMGGRLIAGVLVDFIAWRAALAAMGALSLAAAAAFWAFAPPSRHFHPTPLRPATLIQGLALHLRDPGLPWLFLEGFLLMGAFVTVFNYIAYRLLGPPYGMSQAGVGLLSAVYLAGIYSSARVGALADQLGRRRVFWAVIAVMLAGLGITLLEPLWAILLGMLVFTFGFFGAHSVASSWVGRRAQRAKGQASSLYLLSYYLGSSIAGTAGGLFWHRAGWSGVVLFVGLLLAAALAVAVRLMRVPRIEAAASDRAPRRG